MRKEEMAEHQSLKDHMDVFISTMIHSPPQNTLVIQMDFISNVMLDSPLASSSMHYNKQQITFFSTVLHYYDDDGVLSHDYYDFYSNYLSHVTEFVFHCLATLLDEKEPSKVIVVTDGADQHFRYLRGAALVYWYRNCFMNRQLPILSFNYKIPILWAILRPNHGKSWCDGHGGNVKNKYRASVRSGLSLTSGERFATWVREVRIKNVPIPTKNLDF
jgi:hypothetical protein